MKLTNRQIDFTLAVQTLYDALLSSDGVDMLELLFDASVRHEDLEVARLVGAMIIEISLTGQDVEHLAAQWLELFGVVA